MTEEALIGLLPCPVALVDENGAVRAANASCAQLLGTPLDEIVGRRLILERAIDDSSVTATFEGRRGAPLAASVAPLPDGSDLRLVHLAHDDGPERLRSYVAHVRSVKHDINNPLTGALGNINLLLRRPDLDEKMRRRLSVAEQELKKIGEIILRLSDVKH